MGAAASRHIDHSILCLFTCKYRVLHNVQKACNKEESEVLTSVICTNTGNITLHLFEDSRVIYLLLYLI